MTQPCSMVELVLFDTESLGDPRIAVAVEEVASRGIHRGAISSADDVASALERVGLAERFDLWLPGANETWPFDRATALTGVEPMRIGVVLRENLP